MDPDDENWPSDAVIQWRTRALLLDYLLGAGSYRNQDGLQARWTMIDMISKALDLWDEVWTAVHAGPPQYSFAEIGALARLDETWRRVVTDQPPATTIHERTASSDIMCAAWAALDTFSVRGRHPPERPPELEG